MKLFVLVLLGAVTAQPVPEADPEAQPAAYAANYNHYIPVDYTYEAPVVQAAAAPVVSSQYHAQDEIGNYQYGFQSSDQAKTEVKTTDGVVRGEYSYVDANGLLQRVNYISDALGFRVAATNLPVHQVDASAGVPVAPAVETIEYAAADPTPASPTPAAPAPHQEVVPSVISASVPYAYLPYAINYGYNTPAVSVVAPAPTQYFSEDALSGQYAFGYNDLQSNRQEVKTADGVVRGTYQYVDTDGKLQTVAYLADAAGFHVTGSNIPVHDVSGAPVAPVVNAAPLPVPVVDTPEVAAAKEQHALLYQAALDAAAQADAVEGSGYVEQAYQPEAIAYGALKGSVESEAAPVLTYAQQPAPAVAAVPAVAAPVVQAATIPAVQPVETQYHAQDEAGQYNYGYSDENSVKQEIKTADGVVRGSYSYIDGDGIVQTTNYISDALGFRVSATNLPVHVVGDEAAAAAAAVHAVPAAAPAAPVQAAAAAPVITPQVGYTYLPYATNYAYNYVPVVQSSAAVAAPQPSAAVIPATSAAVPVVPVDTGVVSSQYHAQDELGQYNFGFSSDTQAKTETKTADGITRGAYSYLDANGVVQQVSYISDAMGFRVAATNLPVAVNHAAPAVAVAEESVPAAEPHAVAVEPQPAAVAEQPVLVPQVASYAYLPYAPTYSYNQLIGA